MTVCASSRESNASTESSSSRTREPIDSTNGSATVSRARCSLRGCRRSGTSRGARSRSARARYPSARARGRCLARGRSGRGDGRCGRRRSSGRPGSLAPRGCTRRRRAAPSGCGRRSSCRTGSPTPRRDLGARPAAARQALSRCRAGSACACVAIPAVPPPARAAGCFLRFTVQPSSRTAPQARR